MRKFFALKCLSVLLILTLALSACQAAAPTLEPEQVEQTLQAAMQQTLTAAPTSTPLPTSTSTSTPTITPTPIAVVYGPTNFPDNVNPLTGLEVDDPAILNRLPVMVKVANQLAGRPHAGLTNADIVFDEYIGNGGDRFIALYYSKDEKKVGTVRSGRVADIALVQMYNGILGMMSADEPVLNPILASLGGRVINTEHCDATTQAICNDGPKSEVSAFANTAEMSRLYATRFPADNARKVLEGMAFATIPPAGGETADEFTMHYGKNYNQQWRFDEASKKYLRWIDDGVGGMIPLVDRNNDQQLAFSNVVVIFAQLNTLNNADTIHEYKYSNGGENRAVICRDGKLYDVHYKYTWNQPFYFYDDAGNPFYLQPGNTWIHLTGLGSKLEELPIDDTWMVSLRKP